MSPFLWPTKHAQASESSLCFFYLNTHPVSLQYTTFYWDIKLFFHQHRTTAAAAAAAHRGI